MSWKFLRWLLAGVLLTVYTSLVMVEVMVGILPIEVPLFVMAFVFILLYANSSLATFRLQSPDTDVGRTDPVERAQERYVAGEINDLELEQELEDALDREDY